MEHAIKKGRYQAVQKVANKVYENAMEGKETSAIFFLKNRDPLNWSDRQQVNQINLSNVLQEANNRIIEGKSERLDIQEVQVPMKELQSNKETNK